MVPETPRVAFRIPPDVDHMLRALQWLHQGNQSAAVLEAIRRYYATDGERAEEIRRLVEEAEDG